MGCSTAEGKKAREQLTGHQDVVSCDWAWGSAAVN